MAAVTTQAANLVRQKTYMINDNPGVFYALKALFLHLATNKGNPDLQIVNVDGTFVSSDGGANANEVVVSSAGNLFALYLKQRGLAAETWFKWTDNATTCTTNGGADFTYGFNNAVVKEEVLFLHPVGRTFANGVTMTENTTATGSTLTLKANRLDGYFIISGGLGN